MSQPESAYRKAGVNIDAQDEALAGAGAAIRSTFTKGVVGDVGLFGGLFDPAAAGAAGELLVASADGVGTKTKVAQLVGDVTTIGEDLVNHCVNDILVQGARPLFFLDYVAMGTLVPAQVQGVIHGLAKACRENQCALLGGETAEMPGVYVDGELDVAGTIIGAVSRDHLLDGSGIAVGDLLIGLPSSGLHTNGYSLARRIAFEQEGLAADSRPDVLGGQTVGEAFLAVHRSYLNPVHPLVVDGLLHGMAHITGGGLLDNLPRVLPKDLDAICEVAAIPELPLFRWLVGAGGVAPDEAYRVFNMGCGLVLVVDPKHEPTVMQRLKDAGEAPFILGRVDPGEGKVQLR